MNMISVSQLLAEHPLAAFVIGAFFTLLGIVIKSIMDNNGNVAVAKINSETTLGAKAIETLTMALEVLQEENRSIKQNVKKLENHIDTLIDLIIRLVKAENQQEADDAVADLEVFLRTLGRWPNH